MEEINSRIKRLRKEKGLSQYEISEQLSISQTAYAKIESGKTKSISIEVGKGLAKILNQEFYSLFDVESKGNDQSNLIVELKEENERLKTELEYSKRMNQILIDERMVMAPRQKLVKDNAFLGYGDTEIENSINSKMDIENDLMNRFENDPAFRKIYEEGLVTSGYSLEVWEKYLLLKKQKDKK